MPVKQGQEGVAQEMHKFKHGELRSGSGHKVTDRKQAIVIAMHEAGLSKPKHKHGMNYMHEDDK